jgi:hypothetical protein
MGGLGGGMLLDFWLNVFWGKVKIGGMVLC